MLLLPTENPDEFAALLANLTAEYQPETEMQRIIVNQAARSTWDLARLNREFDKSQHKLYGANPHMHEWDAVQLTEFERMLRYRTKAERAYDRAFHRIEFLRKLRLQAQKSAFTTELLTERLQLSKERLKLAAARQQPKEPEKDTRSIAQWIAPIVHVSQLIEIRWLDGIISYRVHPTLDDVRQWAYRASEGAGVFRRFEFPDGVPPEYAWVNGPGLKRSGIVWEQFFKTTEEWRVHAAWESAAGPNCYFPKRINEPTNEPIKE